jgi:hypothetical protein
VQSNNNDSWLSETDASSGADSVMHKQSHYRALEIRITSGMIALHFFGNQIN